MKNEVFRKMVSCVLLNALALIPLGVAAQKTVRPLAGELLLSGNFGELRSTHFHSGIDIRTGGVEGRPVRCVKAGRLVRVSVSPTGYGQALYVEHADGTTTVYGHLQRFAPKVAELVRKLQYRAESFRLDRDFRQYGICFRAGDTIAWSGNTGSSGGPHLHFEVRDTRSGHTLNPLRWCGIADGRPPVARTLYVYRRSEEGAVELERALPVKPVAAGRYAAATAVLPAGEIGLGVYAADYMDGSRNRLGIYGLTLVVEGDTVYRLKMDSCSFGQGGFINEVKDYGLYGKGETVYRCFGHYQHRFMGADCRRNGFVGVERDSVLHVEMWLDDINGNRSTLEWKIRGGASPVKKPGKGGLLAYGRAHVLEMPGCRLELGPEALFSSVKKVLRKERDTLSGRDVFVFSEKPVPLFGKARLSFSGAFGRHAVICEVRGNGRKYPVDTYRTADGIAADIGSLGRYAVEEDTEAPLIGYIGRPDGRSVRFRLKDRLSGIASWRGEVNGRWCLFSYDPRVDLLQCSLSEALFRPGENEVRVKAADKAGNCRELTVKIRI